MKTAFLPARLVKGADRWYLVWYMSAHGVRRRVKKTFDLNRIHDLKLRERRGLQLVELVNSWLMAGFDGLQFSEEDAVRVLAMKKNGGPSITVEGALEYSLSLKDDLRHDTVKSYQSVARLFLAYAKEKGWSNIDCKLFTRGMAADYMDHCQIERRLSPQSYNNNLRQLRALWEPMVERGHVDKNVWREVKFKSRMKVKRRRNFTQEEAELVVAEIYRTDEVLFLALLLQYACFLRPSEIRRLRRENINLQDGVVMVHEDQAKTGKMRVATIPDEFLPLLRVPDCPGHYYIFGKGLEPHPRTACGRDTMGRRHKKVLERLQKAAKLRDIEGLTWYSWKDTGITDALDELPVLPVQDQAGHHSPNMTMKYRHKRDRNEKMRTFRNRIIKKAPPESGGA